MPRGDRTGPGGTGPKTGKGLGRCGQDNDPSESIKQGGIGRNRGGQGRGSGQGRGQSRGKGGGGRGRGR